MQSHVEEDKRKMQEQLEELWWEMEAFARKGTPVHEVEGHLFRKVLYLGFLLLGYFFRLLGAGDQGEQVKLEDGRVLQRLEGMHARSYWSVFGEFELFRHVYAEREKQAQEYIPLDARLPLPENSYSYLWQEWSQGLAVEFSFEQVTVVLGRMLGWNTGVSALERINRAMAETAAVYWQEAPAQPAPQGEFVVVSADGKGVPMRKPAEAPPIQAHDGHRGPPKERKKMALVGAVYDAQPHVRSAADVLESLFRSPLPVKKAEPEPREERKAPIAKAVRACLTQKAANDQEINAREVIFPWLGEQVRLRDPDGHKPVVVVMDGQACLWSDTQAALGETRTRVEVLDFLHVTEKLWELTHIFDEPAQHRIKMDGYVSMLLHGQARELTVWFRHEAKTRPLATADVRRVESICGYFEHNWERMRYDQYLAAGYPIASGVIEGACRHVVKDRLERTGMHWTVPGAQAMLQLRCIAINPQWAEFTAFRVRRESARLYPHTTLYEVEDWPIPMAA
jgi:hypothetical protein